MPGREPRILQAAWENISSIADYLMQNASVRTAEETTDAILGTIELLGSMPYLGPLHHDPVLQKMGYRKLICGSYLCVYRIIDDVPTVYRVFHTHQDYTWRMK